MYNLTVRATKSSEPVEHFANFALPISIQNAEIYYTLHKLYDLIVFLYADIVVINICYIKADVHTPQWYPPLL